MSIRFLPLSEVENRSQLADMTYPVYRPLLAQTGPDYPSIGVAAFDAEGPCGLGLAFPSEHDEPAHVLSLFVAPSARGQGVGGEVLARLTAQLKERGEPLVVALYPEGKDSTSTVERLLVRQGWSTAEPRLYLFHASKTAVATMTQAHWMRPRTLPSGYTMFDWLDATEADKAAALEYENSPGFPHGISAFQEAETVNPVTSLGLRENGRLVGWLLTHRAGADMLRYTCLYIHPATEVKGLGFRLLSESLRRLTASTAIQNDMRIGCGVLADNQPMLDFFHRRIGPNLTDLTATLTVDRVKYLA
jgi:ribosomal protein S18 acetylase RimI-like enzyme